jgi:hypothetical protein
MANFETEWELEEELHETGGGEGEGILGTIGNVLGGLLGEEELEQHELAHEFESPELAHEFESEFEHPELAHEFETHESAHEFEHPELAHEFESHELAHEFEHPELAHEFETHESAHEFEQHEFEGGEQFFGRAFRGIRGLVRRAAPFLKRIAKIAAPIVGTAIGGPFGSIIGKAAGSLLGEQELEQHELAHEFEQHEFEQHEFEQHEFETHEAAHEVAHEIAHHETTHHEALAEMMAEAASHEQHEGEAEAMAGAAVVTVISPRDRRALRRILPHLVRGVAILTRILRRRRITRPAVRAVPTIVRRTVSALKRQAAAGQPVTRRAAARAAATQVRTVLGNPSVCAAAIAHNLRASRAVRGVRGMRPTAG